jgi:hypothetical protein
VGSRRLAVALPFRMQGSRCVTFTRLRVETRFVKEESTTMSTTKETKMSGERKMVAVGMDILEYEHLVGFAERLAVATGEGEVPLSEACGWAIRFFEDVVFGTPNLAPYPVPSPALLAAAAKRHTNSALARFWPKWPALRKGYMARLKSLRRVERRKVSGSHRSGR